MKTASRIRVVALLLCFVSAEAFAQTAGSLVLDGIERITDTGIDGPGFWRSNLTLRKYRREINLIGSINGIASIPPNRSNGTTDYNSLLVDQSDTAYDRTQSSSGDYGFTSNYRVEFVGFTSPLTLRDVSGKLIIKESFYEAQRLSNPAVSVVFPRSVQTYPINGEPYVVLTPVTNPPGSSKWANLSTRVFAGTGANALAVGFVITGTVPKNYLVRVVGPSLGQFGITGFLPDPAFQVIPSSGSAPVAQNNDWGGSQALATTMASVGAFSFSNAASKDAAAVVTLAPGGYSVVVQTTAANSGIALVEVYELP
jgi:hypothetical protein